MKEKHICKFKRLRYKSGNEVFFCTMPDCNKKMNPALCLGKKSICWRCGEEFILNEYALRLAKPHCENCHKPKKSVLPGSEVSVPTIQRIDFGKDKDFTIEIDASERQMINPIHTTTLAERLQQTLKEAAVQKDEDI